VLLKLPINRDHSSRVNYVPNHVPDIESENKLNRAVPFELESALCHCFP